MTKNLILLSFLLAPLASFASDQKAVFAGGCFWSMVRAFDGKPGVKAVLSGYSGGTKDRPTYEEVGTQKTGHTESIEVTFDDKKVTYDQLLDIYWSHVDPTDAGGQFVDRGNDYRPAIFYVNPTQKLEASKSMKKLEDSRRFNKKIMVEIAPLKKFWPAEEYHQYYYKKNPEHYNAYRRGSGRDDFIKAHWGEEAAKH